MGTVITGSVSTGIMRVSSESTGSVSRGTGDGRSEYKCNEEGSVSTGSVSTSSVRAGSGNVGSVSAGIMTVGSVCTVMVSTSPVRVASVSTGSVSAGTGRATPVDTGSVKIGAGRVVGPTQYMSRSVMMTKILASRLIEYWTVGLWNIVEEACRLLRGMMQNISYKAS